MHHSRWVGENITFWRRHHDQITIGGLSEVHVSIYKIFGINIIRLIYWLFFMSTEWHKMVLNCFVGFFRKCAISINARKNAILYEYWLVFLELCINVNTPNISKALIIGVKIYISEFLPPVRYLLSRKATSSVCRARVEYHTAIITICHQKPG